MIGQINEVLEMSSEAEKIGLCHGIPWLDEKIKSISNKKCKIATIVSRQPFDKTLLAYHSKLKGSLRIALQSGKEKYYEKWCINVGSNSRA